MKRTSIWIGIAILVAIIAYASWNNSKPSSTGKQEIRIGAIIPLTGQAAYYGEFARNGMELAREELQTQFPGITITVVYEDSAYNAKSGVDAFQKIAATLQPRIIISGTSPTSMAIAPLTKEKRILQMAVFSSTDGYTSPDDLTFRVSPRNEIEAEAIAHYIKGQGIERLGILHVKNDQGTSFAKKLKDQLAKISAPTQIVFEEGYPAELTDARTHLIKAKAAGVQAISMIGTGKHYATIFKQAYELGVDVPFLSSRTAEDPVVLEAPKEIISKLVYTYPFDPATADPTAKSFTDRFKTKYNKLPDTYAAEGYEAMRLVVLAGRVCKEDTTCMKKFLESQQSYDSIFGKLSFDKNGDVFYPMFLKTVKNGQFVRLQMP